VPGRCGARSKAVSKIRLSEELLRGSFQGNNRIVIDVIRDDEGKIRRLDFRGETHDDPANGEALAHRFPGER
jgi:hypothetical protein